MIVCNTKIEKKKNKETILYILLHNKKTLNLIRRIINKLLLLFIQQHNNGDSEYLHVVDYIIYQHFK